MQSAQTSDLLNLQHFALAVFMIPWGLAVIFPRRQARPLRYFGYVLVLLGINIFFPSLYNSGVHYQLPHLPGVQLPIMVTTGPCLHFSARVVADAWEPAPIHLARFIPSLLTIAIYTPI